MSDVPTDPELEARESLPGLVRRARWSAWLGDGLGGIATELGEAARRQAFWALAATAGAAWLQRRARRANEQLAEAIPDVFDIPVGPAGMTEVDVDPFDELELRMRGVLADLEPLLDDLDADQRAAAEAELARVRKLLDGEALTPEDIASLSIPMRTVLGLPEQLASDRLLDPARGALPTDGCPHCAALSGHVLGCPLEALDEAPEAAGVCTNPHPDHDRCRGKAISGAGDVVDEHQPNPRHSLFIDEGGGG